MRIRDFFHVITIRGWFVLLLLLAFVLTGIVGLFDMIFHLWP